MVLPGEGRWVKVEEEWKIAYTNLFYYQTLELTCMQHSLTQQQCCLTKGGVPQFSYSYLFILFFSGEHEGRAYGCTPKTTIWCPKYHYEVTLATCCCQHQRSDGIGCARCLPDAQEEEEERSSLSWLVWVLTIYVSYSRSFVSCLLLTWLWWESY